MRNIKIVQLTTVFSAGLLSFGLVSIAHATLETRLGGLAYYDTVLDITWLADANAGAGSSFDDGVNNADGRMTWANANAWAASINVSGITGWRLPILSPIDSSNFAFAFSNNATTDRGYAPTTTDGADGGWRDSLGNAVSEMGHMYYVNLGNRGFCMPDNGNPSGCVEQTGWGLANTGPFSNIQPFQYWSSMAFSPFPNNAWNFYFNIGLHGAKKESDNFYAWAVHSGDVGVYAIPEPGTIVLMELGLVGLIGMSVRRQRRL